MGKLTAMEAIALDSHHPGHNPADPRTILVEELAAVMCGCCSDGTLRWLVPGSAAEWAHAEPYGYDANECEAGYMLTAAVSVGVPVYTGADLEFDERD